jgi:hypothetical protein
MQKKDRDFSVFKKRILKYLDYKGISKYECYQKTGITNGIFSQNNGISEENMLKFLSCYSDINPEWLLAGKEPMLKSDSPAPPVHNIYVEPSLEAQTPPKSTEPTPVDFSLILERYEYLAGEVARLREKNKKLEEENADLKKKNSRSGDYDYNNIP